MSYNLLKNALSITNSDLCLYDSPHAYTTDFNINGNVDGWDVYNNIYLYGCWGGVLFGTSYTGNSYIGRSEVFSYLNAEEFYYVQIMMKITDNNQDAAVPTLTKGKIRWATIEDSVWDSDKEFEFDLIIDDQWHLYTLNLGPAKYWVGEINNLRIYPFIDGREGDQFAIKYIRITSLDHWLCTNTSCSYYLSYEHPCPGAGSHGYVEAEQAKTSYSTISGVSDLLEVNIDSYGYAKFSLGNNLNVTGSDMAKIVSSAISSLDVGGYCYCSVIHTEFYKLKIISGTAGSLSNVDILDNACSRALGFFNSEGDITYISHAGTDVATGFDYASTKLLTAFEINQLINGDKYSSAYRHLPENYSLEVGRQDYSDVGMNISSTDSIYDEYNPLNSLANRGKTLLDWSHPVNNNGLLKKITVAGKRYDNAKIKVCRPRIDGTLDVIYSLDFPTQNGFYTRSNVMHSIECSILVSKGDILAFYDFDLSTGTTMTGLPDATYSQVSGEVSGNFDPGKTYSYGVGGFIFYGRSNRYQSNTILDIDLGDRFNVESVEVYGAEETAYFEYNVVSCLDVNWTVDLHGGTHKHNVVLVPNAWTDTHTNIAYGVSCLGDMIRTADNGKAGDSYSHNSTGVVTTGEHSYFYVNGDAEWLQPEEYSYIYTVSVYDFENDKITFNLNFPQGAFLDIHKSIMYFKERKNFRSFALYYYLGPEDLSGNYVDSRHRLIPSFNSITLDGIKYYSDHEFVGEYLFENPASATIEYGVGGVVTDFPHLRAVTRTDWLVMEHEFNPIRCQGFNIETTYHKSTKITELEVYSKMTMEPSLTDNILLQYSAYGDVWRTADFSKDTIEEKVVASIGGAPRYFKVELESPINFYLNEIDFIPGEQVINTECSKDVLISDAAINKDNASTEIDIYNMYDTSFDLYVDIPRNLSSARNILFWSSLDSQDRVENPQVGPGCVFKGRNNYPIANINGQCAINVPAYGLKNLIHNKEAYVCYNTEVWQDYGTLTSGVSLDFNLGAYINSKVTTIKFPAVSAKYWKVEFDVSYDAYVKDVFAYKDDTLMSIENIYFKQDLGGSHMTSPISSDGTDLDTIRGLNTNDDFTGTNGDLPNTSIWYRYLTSANQSFTIQNNKLYVSSTTAVQYAQSALRTNYYVLGDFDIQIDFSDFSTAGDGGIPGMTFAIKTTAGDGAILGPGRTSTTNIWVWERLYAGGSYDLYTTTRSNNYGKIRFVRSGATVTLYRIDGSGTSWIQTASFTINTKDMQLEIRVGAGDGHAISGNFDNMLINSGIVALKDFTASYAFGFNLEDNEPLDTIKFIHGDSTVSSPQIYISSDNINYFSWKSAAEYITSTDNNHIKFAIDLELRHSLDILRNYGTGINRYVFPETSVPSDSSSYISFYNTLDPRDSWTNYSSKDDARWLGLNLLSTDSNIRLYKLGIYPDITRAYCLGGGYNCEWEDLGTILTDYTIPINVAFGTEVSGIYSSSLAPEKAVDGNYGETAAECWGFEDSGTDPYIDILFDQNYTIDRIVIYHGYNDTDTTFMNTAYNVKVSPTVSGNDFTQIFSISGNTYNTRTHTFTAVDARRVRLTITAYNSTYMNLDGDLFYGSFIREIEVYNKTSTGKVSSEDYPLVCIDLKDKFNIVGHYLDTGSTDTTIAWDNAENFFYYSDDLYNAPEKITFSSSGQYYYVLNSTYSTGDLTGGVSEYTIASNIYIPAGIYNVDWDCYDYDAGDEKISIRLDGNDVVDVFATNVGNNTWIAQSSEINILNSGYYDILVKQHTDPSYNWGARNVKIYRRLSYGRWLAVKRDTATNYAYDGDSNKYGIDYLDKIRVYGSINYKPTEYPWWWATAGVSTLSSDYLKVKEDNRSLCISYPASSDVDYILFYPGDDFGTDVDWSIKDFLSFWIYVSDISKLDLDSTSVEFGVATSNQTYYYKWFLSNYTLVTGWNKLKLKFEDYDILFPQPDSYYTSIFLSTDFNLQDKEDPNNYIKFNYKGIGQAFTIYITDINIERNRFDEEVYDSSGLFIYDREYMLIPVTGLTLDVGTIELWLNPYYDSKGVDIFGDTVSRTIFSIVNNSNNIVSLGIKAGNWFELVFGHEREEANLVDAAEFTALQNAFNRGTSMHIAVVWDASGKHTDNGDTLRFYVNSDIAFSSKVSWEIKDNKSTTVKLGGGNSPLAYNYDVASGGGVFKDIKLYDYCKTDFSDYTDAASSAKVYTAEDYMLISKDNVNFYGKGSENIPLIFEKVPSRDSAKIYVKTIKDGTFKYSNKTADLIITWLTSV